MPHKPSKDGELSVTDIAWLAGFYEGEGTCCMSTQKGYPILKVSLSQVDPTPLNWIKYKYGGYIYKKINRKSSFGKKPIHIYSVVSKKARMFLGMVLPYMKSKYKITQATHALNLDAKLVNPRWKQDYKTDKYGRICAA